MSAYMKPSRSPSSRTCGKMPTRSAKSMDRSAAAPPGRHRRAAAESELLLHGRGSDGQTLGFLVLAPLLGIVRGDLHDVVRRLLGIALVVEVDRPGHAGELHFADGGRHGFARGCLAALGDFFERLDRDGGGDV